MFENRLERNARERFKWAKREGLTAFRLYDLDIPEFPFAVDWYAGFAHVMEFPRRSAVRTGTLDLARTEARAAISKVLKLPDERIFVKTHQPKAWGEEQYQSPSSRRGQTVVVEENGLKFEVNLSDYLDTGLFLDHRNTRLRVKKEAQGKRFLNLFAYTGSFSVYAAAGGAQTTTVDLSNTYCDWAERNFALNGLSKQHTVVRADVVRWLDSARGPFDLVVLDPPSFSASKKMGGRFDVQSDHLRLIERVLGLLAPGGTLYFSTNFLGFELDASLRPAEELTPKSMPRDFRRTVHRCWRFNLPRGVDE